MRVKLSGGRRVVCCPGSSYLVAELEPKIKLSSYVCFAFGTAAIGQHC